MRRRCGNSRGSTDPGSRLTWVPVGPGAIPSRRAGPGFTRRDRPGTDGQYGSGPAIPREVHIRGPRCAFHHPAGCSGVPDARVDRVGVRAWPHRRTVGPARTAGPPHARAALDRRTVAAARPVGPARGRIRRRPAIRGRRQAPARPVPGPPHVDMTCDLLVRRHGEGRRRSLAGAGGCRWRGPMRAPGAAAGGAR